MFRYVFRYGDKTPRSVGGRIFGILWVFVGVVMTSLLTATLAAAFSTRAITASDIRGMEVSRRNLVPYVKVLLRTIRPLIT